MQDKIIGMLSDYVNVRAVPGISGSGVGRIYKWSRIRVNDNGATADGLTWVFVEAGDIKGYIALQPHVKLYDPVRDDMFHYIFGVEGDGPVHTLKTSWAGDGEMIQIQSEGGNFYLTKGHGIDNRNYEAFTVTPKGIYRRYDTSPGPHPKDSQQRERVYQIHDGANHSWLHRYMKPGERVTYNVYIDWFYKATGEPYPGEEHVYFPHVIELTAIHESYTFPSGITLNNVAEINSFFPDGKPFETFYFARGRGLVGWKDNTGSGRESYISGFVDAPGKLTRERISWRGYPSRPAVIYDAWNVPPPAPPEPTQQQVQAQFNEIERQLKTLRGMIEQLI